jgi:transcription factor TFIIIB component B''
MQILARMTGKDFSGPPPEIRAPALRRMPDDTNVGVEQHDSLPDSEREQHATPTFDEAELVNEVEENSVEM